MNWFPDWLAIHLRRHALAGLPAANDNYEMYDAWRSEFARLGITEQAASRASGILASRSYAKGAHFPALVKLAVVCSRTRPSAAPADATRRACEYCDGHGTVEVVDDAWGYHWGAFCLCNYGRLRLDQTREAMKSDSRAVVVLDYGDILAGNAHRVTRSGETMVVTFSQAHTDEQLDYTHLLPPGHLRDLAEKLRPHGIPRAPAPSSSESNNADAQRPGPARRLADARRDHPRALPVPAALAAPAVH